MTPDAFASLALSLPGAVAGAHFGKRDFRNARGKIFASLPDETRAVVNFSPDQQALMVEMHGTLFSPLPNAWGLKGWTQLALEDCPEDIALRALEMALANLAKPAKKTRA